jgi:ABC-type sugar transport system ATPase subunit
VIFVTHHVEEVIEVADRVSLMKDGLLVDSFAVSALLQSTRTSNSLAATTSLRRPAADLRPGRPTDASCQKPMPSLSYKMNGLTMVVRRERGGV